MEFACLLCIRWVFIPTHLPFSDMRRLLLYVAFVRVLHDWITFWILTVYCCWFVNIAFHFYYYFFFWQILNENARFFLLNRIHDYFFQNKIKENVSCPLTRLWNASIFEKQSSNSRINGNERKKHTQTPFTTTTIYSHHFSQFKWEFDGYEIKAPQFKRKNDRKIRRKVE